MCDNSKQAIEIIKKNIEKTHLQDKIQLYTTNYEETLKKLQGNQFDIIYLDPPYKTDFIKKSLELIKNYDLAHKNTKIIAETDEKERIIKDIENLKLKVQDIRKYGRAYIIFINLDDSETERG